MLTAGTRVFGWGAIFLGLVGLAWGDFALVWQPVPAALPGRTILAYAFAAALTLGGAALNWSRTAARGAALLCGLFALVVVLLHGPRVIARPLVLASWSALAEQLVLTCAALLAYAWLSRGGPRGGARLRRLAQLTFGGCLIVFGLAHFFYLAFTAAMVPAWLVPGQSFWAVLTGIAHLLAGLAILSGVCAHLAAILLTVMFAIFGLLVHAPALLKECTATSTG